MDSCIAKTWDPKETTRNFAWPNPVAAHGCFHLPNILTPHARGNRCRVTPGYSQAVPKPDSSRAAVSQQPPAFPWAGGAAYSPACHRALHSSAQPIQGQIFLPGKHRERETRSNRPSVKHHRQQRLFQAPFLHGAAAGKSTAGSVFGPRGAPSTQLQAGCLAPKCPYKAALPAAVAGAAGGQRRSCESAKLSVQHHLHAKKRTQQGSPQSQPCPGTC